MSFNVTPPPNRSSRGLLLARRWLRVPQLSYSAASAAAGAASRPGGPVLRHGNAVAAEVEHQRAAPEQVGAQRAVRVRAQRQVARVAPHLTATQMLLATSCDAV